MESAHIFGALIGLITGSIGAVCVLKGKNGAGAFALSGPVAGLAVLIALVAALVGGGGFIMLASALGKIVAEAIRPAKPGSWWFEQRYDDQGRRRARDRHPHPSSTLDQRTTGAVLAAWVAISVVAALLLVASQPLLSGWLGAGGVAAAPAVVVLLHRTRWARVEGFCERVR